VADEKRVKDDHELRGQGAKQPGAPPPSVPAFGSESSVPNRPDIPGGSFRPAQTPGALGPTTRDTDRPG